MKNYIDDLANVLQLTPFQAGVLKSKYDMYCVGRMQKRGGNLFVPYKAKNIWDKFVNVICGCPGDLVGTDKMLVECQRHIGLTANGYHCVKVGMYKYWADNDGNVVSRDVYLDNCKSN